MPHTAIPDLTDAVAIQPGAVVSKVVHRSEGLDVTMFAIDRGEGLTEHTAARPAILQVLGGRLRVTVDGETMELGAGAWLHMDAGTSHSLVAIEPTRFLLTLLPR